MTPKTFDQIPDALFDCWTALGIQHEALTLDATRHMWMVDRAPPEHYFIAREVFAPPTPADQFPECAQALLKLLEDTPAVEQKKGFLSCALPLFFDGVTVFQIAGIYQQIAAGAAYKDSLRPLPRSDAEREALTELLLRTEDVVIQRALLRTICRHPTPYEPSASLTLRDALLERLVDELPDEFWHFNCNMMAQTIGDSLTNKDLLIRIASKGDESLVRKAMYQFALLICDKEDQADDWDAMKPVIAANPEIFVHVRPNWISFDLIQLLWDAGTPLTRHAAIIKLLQLISNKIDSDKLSTYIDYLEHLTDSPDFQQLVFCSEPWDNRLVLASPDALQLLWERKHPAIFPWIFSALGYKLNEGAWRITSFTRSSQKVSKKDADFIRTALTGSTHQFNEVKPMDLAALMPHVDDQTLLAISDQLKPIVAKAKSMHKKLIKRLAKIEPATLVEAGWIDDRRKGVRGVALEALLLSTSEQAAEPLRTLHCDERLGDADKERIFKRLKKLGAAVGGLTSINALSTDDMEQRASTAKITSHVTNLWSKELTNLFNPVDAATARWLLNLTHDSKSAKLPGAVIKALAKLPPENQARLAEHLTQLWIASNGDSKLRWLLRFVPDYGDDRIVDPLIAAFKGWYKRAKPKAIVVLNTLSSLKTVYALTLPHEVYTQSKYSDSLYESAKKILKAAARKRNVSLKDMFDELTPDFGLGPNGLILDVGPYAYVVTISGDFSLRVKNINTDKVTKTLPKARKEELPELRASAESQYKFLRTNLKKVARQQATRLSEAMINNRQWSAARWQTLFVDHPLLSVIGQSIIWQVNDVVAFRASEDHSLVDVADNTITLSPNDKISLWHPANATSEQVNAWRQHFSDYELTEFLNQLDRARVTLSEEELEANTITQFNELRVAQFLVKRMVQSWNYEALDHDSSTITGYERNYSDLGISVVLAVEGVEPYSVNGQTTQIEGFTFHKGTSVPMQLKDVPSALLAEALEHGAKLTASAAN